MLRPLKPYFSFKSFPVLLLLFLLFSCETEKENKADSFQTHFERTDGEETATYLQTIDFYIRLAKEFPEINIQTMGETDSGYPLHIVNLQSRWRFQFSENRGGQDRDVDQ